MTNEAVAQALGFTRKSGTQHTWIDCSGKEFCEAELWPWLNSADGREKIRDRVRKLALLRGHNYLYAITYLPSGFTSICTMCPYVLGGGLTEDERFGSGPTESAAWLAALNFLWKEKEK